MSQNDDDYYANIPEYKDPNRHHNLEDGVYEQGQQYNSSDCYEDRQAHLQNMRDDTAEAIRSRQEENDRVGDDNGELEGHEDRVGVLESNDAALRLEQYYTSQEEAGQERSEWNEERGEWGDIQEADYENEPGPEEEEQDEEDDYGEADMDESE